MGEKLIDSLRDTSTSAAKKAERKEKKEMRRREREMQERTDAYVAEHTDEYIGRLTVAARERAAEGETSASIHDTVGREDRWGLSRSMQLVQEHFEDEGFTTKDKRSDDSHWTAFGSDGEEFVEGTRFTIGVEISWVPED